MPKLNHYYEGPRSDHFDGRRFFNPGQAPTDRSLQQMLRWKLGGAAQRWPRSVEVVQAVPDRSVDGLRVTAVGHSTLLIQVAGTNILTDPIWSERASPFSFAGPRRVTRPGIAFEALPPIDIVLASHNHYDHLDRSTVRRLKATHDPQFVTPLGNDTIIERIVPGARIITGDWGDRLTIGNVTVDIVPAYHWSTRRLGDLRMALWCGFVIEAGASRIYFAGDTGYGDGAPFRALRSRYDRIDLALIPIGAYAPRWFMSAQHVDPEEAVQIMTDCGARRALGIHWGTFQLTDEMREEPRNRLRAALDRQNIAHDRFVAAEPGQLFDLSVG